MTVLPQQAQSFSSSAVPFFDLKAQYSEIRSDIEKALARVLESQQFILGPEVSALEEELAAYCGVRHAIAVSSGSDALLLALMALEIGSGDEVLTTPFTFFATVGAIARLGAKPTFVDIEPQSFNIDPSLIEQRITKKTKAILPVHLFGQCASMQPIQQLASCYSLPVIEDAAQAIGASYDGVRAGALGQLACFSFFPTKNLGAFGEGGLLTTNNSALAERVRLLRTHGAKSEYQHELIGGNFRLHALQAAVLRVKLPHLERWNEKRRQNAQCYANLFNAAGLTKLTLPMEIKPCHHVYHQYVIRAPRRDELLSFLTERKIGAKVYYPRSQHLQQCFASLGAKAGDFPVAEQATKEVLALPIYPELSHEAQERVVNAIADFYAKG